MKWYNKKTVPVIITIADDPDIQFVMDYVASQMDYFDFVKGSEPYLMDVGLRKADVVVLDYSISERLGYDLYKEIKSDRDAKDLPVILIAEKMQDDKIIPPDVCLILRDINFEELIKLVEKLAYGI